MNIALCEDEKSYSDMLSKCITDCFLEMGKECFITSFYDGKSILDNYTPCFDLIFLDIKLPDINGFEIAKKIREKDENVIIIFITATDEYVFDGYEVNAFRYIVKNKVDNDFQGIIKKVCQDALAISDNHREKIVLKKGNKQIILKTSDIIYITSNLRKLIFCTTEGNYEIYAKLSDYAFLEKHNSFVRCHKAFIINLEYITSFDTKSIYVSEGQHIPVSAINKNKVNSKIINFMSKRSVFNVGD